MNEEKDEEPFEPLTYEVWFASRVIALYREWVKAGRPGL